MKAPHGTGDRSSAERVYGLAAAKAAFAVRPDSVLSIAHTEELRQPLADMLRSAARRRIAYREVDPEELTRMAQSVHHEGVCLLLRPRDMPGSTLLWKRIGERGLVLALDGVQNPHNVGAILRSAAYFGVSGMIYGADTGGRKSARVSPPLTLPAAARRVAEGGAEYVPVVGTDNLMDPLQEARRAGITIIGCDAHAEHDLTAFEWPARAVLVLGHEQHGLTREVRASCQHLVRIAGHARIDSLNVSVAAGVFLASYVQAHGVPDGA